MLQIPKQRDLYRVIAVIAMFAFAVSCNDHRLAEDMPKSLIHSICGETNDLQFVESFEGRLGLTPEFVWEQSRAVGVLRKTSGKRHCSATLIASDVILTAGHCIADDILTQVVDFNFHQNSQITSYPISAVLELRNSDLDYALLRLEGDASLDAGVARIEPMADLEDSTPLVILQHPQGQPMQVGTGYLVKVTHDSLYYAGIDTLTGSSGAGVLSFEGRLVGIHVGGGCGSSQGANRGVSIDGIFRASDFLRRLLKEKEAASPLEILDSALLSFRGDRTNLGD